mgnify:CR=1 FL=1
MEKNKPKEITGLVIEGDKKASGLGFPTANVVSTTILESGIFAGRVSTIDGDFDAVLYISNRNKKMIEAHLFDFNTDIYGETIVIEIGPKSLPKPTVNPLFMPLTAMSMMGLM